MSAFNPTDQIVSIYYRAYAEETITVPLRNTPFEFDEKQMEVYNKTSETETFRMIPMQEFGSHSVSLPIDKVVADLIKNLQLKS
jgi:hypothetical protein